MRQPASAFTSTRRLVLITQDVLRTASDPYTCYADLKEDIRRRCARLHVSYDGGQVADALDCLEHGGERPLIAPKLVRRLVEKPPDPEIIPRDAAAGILHALYTRRLRDLREAYARAHAMVDEAGKC